jgi:hypothetical protein
MCNTIHRTLSESMGTANGRNRRLSPNRGPPTTCSFILLFRSQLIAAIIHWSRCEKIRTVIKKPFVKQSRACKPYISLLANIIYLSEIALCHCLVSRRDLFSPNKLLAMSLQLQQRGSCPGYALRKCPIV